MARWNAWAVLLLLLSLVLSGCATPFRDRQPELNQEFPAVEQPTQSFAQPNNGGGDQLQENGASPQTASGDSTAEEVDAIQAEIDEMLRMLEETDSEIVIP